MLFPDLDAACMQANIDMTDKLTNWLPTTDPCSGWIGVTCTGGSVTALCACLIACLLSHAMQSMPSFGKSASRLVQDLQPSRASSAFKWEHVQALCVVMLLCGMCT